MSDERPNFRLADLDNQKCATCQHSKKDADENTFCTLGGGDGQRVNQNFVCDSFAG